MKIYKCNFDGSCQPVNPSGYMGAGIVIESDDNIYEQAIGYPKHENNSNNLAEYKAFNRILQLMKGKMGDHIIIQGDSNLVVNQMLGNWQIKAGSYAREALECLMLFKELCKHNKVELSWVRRNFNQKANELANMGAQLSVITNQCENKVVNKKKE